MSQPQPSSYPHYQALAAKDGYASALKQAAHDVDTLLEGVGKHRDLYVAVYYGCRSGMLLLGFLGGLAVAWLMACGSMFHTEPPKDWPALETRVHRVGLVELHKRCAKYMTTGQKLMSLGIVGGCAEIDFANSRCDIWLGQGENSPELEEHERLHCLGHDHTEDTTLRDAWNEWRAR